MGTTTLGELIRRTVTRLSMVPGIAVQIYAEDRIAEMIQHKFTIVRDELWWDDLMTYTELTQDANGRPVENVVRDLPALPLGDEIVINSFNDIQHVWVPNRARPLVDLPIRQSPTGALRTGTTMYKMADPVKVIRVAPFSPGDKFIVRHRLPLRTFKPSDIVPMDDQLMILGATYDYLEDDGSNPRQIEKFMNMYNARLTQLRSDENDRTIQLSPMASAHNSGWQVVS